MKGVADLKITATSLAVWSRLGQTSDLEVWGIVSLCSLNGCKVRGRQSWGWEKVSLKSYNLRRSCMLHIEIASLREAQVRYSDGAYFEGPQLCSPLVYKNVWYLFGNLWCPLVMSQMAKDVAALLGAVRPSWNIPTLLHNMEIVHNQNFMAVYTKVRWIVEFLVPSSKLVKILHRNQYTQRKIWYLFNKKNGESSKMGHIFTK